MEVTGHLPQAGVKRLRLAFEGNATYEVTLTGAELGALPIAPGDTLDACLLHEEPWLPETVLVLRTPEGSLLYAHHQLTALSSLWSTPRRCFDDGRYPAMSLGDVTCDTYDGCGWVRLHDVHASLSAAIIAHP